MATVVMIKSGSRSRLSWTRAAVKLVLVPVIVGAYGAIEIHPMLPIGLSLLLLILSGPHEFPAQPISNQQMTE